MDFKTRFKNPLFLITLAGLLFSSAGIDVNTLTSWPLVIEAIKGIFTNPVALVSFIVALIGQFNNPVTSGLKD